MKAARQRLGQLLWPRRPDASPLTLQQRRIYVLPTKAGVMYAITLLLLLIASINYNLSLGYALTFLLVGLGIVAIVHSFRNLYDLRLQTDRHTPGFAGTQLHFGITLSSDRPRNALLLQLEGKLSTPTVCHVNNSHSVQLPLLAQQRGWQAMPRLTLSTTWPLGLVRAWSHAYFDERCLAYPAPADLAPVGNPLGGPGRQHTLDEPDDFFGLRPHRRTDLRQQVAWKASARLDDALLTKQFTAEQGETLYFDLGRTPGTTLEKKLSLLTRQVLDANKTGLHYGLRLGNTQLPAATGNDHLQACLQALALYV